MHRFFRALNRGPVFRLTHAIQRWRRQRQFSHWRCHTNQTASLDAEVLIVGGEDVFGWIQIGAGTEVQRHCRISIGEDKSQEPRLIIGKRVFVGQGTQFSVMRPMTIGDNALIGANCYLLTNQHRFASREIPIRDQGYECRPLTIGEDVWIGANSILMPGVVVGKGAIIGAGSVLNRSVEPYEIWAGVPARKIRTRP